MIYYVKGELITAELSAIIVDTGTIAYKLYVSDNTLAAFASKIGQKIKAYTYLAVREDAVDLYGFHSAEEKDAFNLLISVSGVGPKAALAILSVLTPDGLKLAVTSGDTKAISKANGVGAKIAARIALELKDKITKELGSINTDNLDAAVLKGQSGASSKHSDALNALIVLGYSRSDAADALKNLNTNALTLEELITAALKNLMR